MKKYIQAIISMVVLGLGVALPVAAQDATYSCGAYGAGDYSNHDCVPDSGGGSDDGNVSSGAGTDDSSETMGGNGSSADGAGTGNEEGSAADNKKDSEKDLEGGVFSVVFAKLATSWGWVLLFGILIVVGVIIIGLTWRHRREN